jgi:hypothetical protein
MKAHPPPHLLALLLLLASAPAPAGGQSRAVLAPDTRESARAVVPRARRIAPLRADRTQGGTCVIVTSDAPLDDYAAFRRGGHFFVRLPQSAADGARQAVSGRGFDASSVEQDGPDLLLSFRLEPGASVRVSQRFNRLDIIFMLENSPPVGVAVAADSRQAVSQQAAGRDEERLSRVLRRVEELEARVRELEAKLDAGPARADAGHAPAVAHAPPPPTPRAGENVSTPPGAGDDAHDAGGREPRRPTGPPRMQIQGFADLNLRASSERGQTTSFSLGQLDLFVTSRLSENFSVLGELVLEAEEDNSFTFTVHRLLLRYAPRDYFTLSAGRDHTSIGYYNTAYHHGSWFQTAARRPYLFTFEGKGGPLPLHNTGVSVSGRIPKVPFGLRYVAEIGNGRSVNTSPERSVATAVDENNGKAFNLALISRPSRLPGFQTGFSVYRDRRTPAGLAPVGETIMAAHLVYRGPRVELLNEAVVVRHAAGARAFSTPGFYTQLSRRFGDARPYFRYQYVNAPDGDPIFRPLDVGLRHGPALGLRYDVSEFAAFKMQYDRTHRRRRHALDELILQFAFTF